MSFNVAMLKQMQAEGLSFDAAIRILEAGEKKADTTNAVRQARYRARKSTESNGVTVTDAPPKDNSKPHSVSDETGASADPVKELFDLGVTLLKSQGHSERESRSIVGSWRKGRSPGEVVAALVDAKTRSISNLVEWMPKRLNGRQTGPPGGDFMEHYERELEQRTVTN